ncbi:MAG: 4Fe-4S binding protein [Ruthenibacterium lactatiformans]
MVCPAPEDPPEQCIGCGKCAEICPGHTITVENGKAYRAEGLHPLFCCHEMCPAKAIDVKRAGIFNL